MRWRFELLPLIKCSVANGEPRISDAEHISSIAAQSSSAPPDAA